MAHDCVSDDARALPADNGRSAGPGIVDSLRREIARIEGFAARRDAPCLPFGAPRLDRLMGGGLALGACHDIVAARPGDGAALSGFALALAARLRAAPPSRRRHVVWIIERLMALEHGCLHPAGLAALGLDPALFLVVTVDTQQEALAAMEEALRACGPALTVLETHGAGRALTSFASRRLALAAEKGGGLGLLLRHGDAPALPFSQRFAIASAPSAEPFALGGLALPSMPVFDCALVKNRLGPGGRFLLRFDPQTACFTEISSSQPELSDDERSSPALPRLVVPFPADRPAEAA